MPLWAITHLPSLKTTLPQLRLLTEYITMLTKIPVSNNSVNIRRVKGIKGIFQRQKKPRSSSFGATEIFEELSGLIVPSQLVDTDKLWTKSHFLRICSYIRSLFAFLSAAICSMHSCPQSCSTMLPPVLSNSCYGNQRKQAKTDSPFVCQSVCLPTTLSWATKMLPVPEEPPLRPLIEKKDVWQRHVF